MPGWAQSSATDPPDLALEGIVPTIENGRRVYSVAQFARFAPQNAADIAAQIPGFTISSVSNDRGLGEASQNVLINGQRITGKGNDAQAVLRRIPVSAVQRLEVVDAATLDISGLSGHVLNVVAVQGSFEGNFAWRPQIRERIKDHWTAGDVSVSGKIPAGSFTIGLRWDGFRGGGWGGETETRPATGESWWRAQQPRFRNDLPKLSASFNRSSEGGALWNINASLDRQRFERRVTTLYQRITQQPTTEISRSNNERWRTEVGTDYEFAFGAGRLKLVAFFTERDGPNTSELTSLVDGATVPTGSRFVRDSTEGERVLRSEYRWKAAGGDWTVSAEAARNFVDATGEFYSLDSLGVYQPIPLPGASSRVEEDRGESILSFSRPIAEGWTLQMSGGVEHSVLRQDGENGQTRRFWRPKGSVSVAWNPPSQWELNLKLQRKVGQLNFFDFLSSVDLQNNNENGANSELVPPQSWVAQFEAIRNLGNAGKIRLTLEAEDIEDVVDQIPIVSTGKEAPGNLPKARRLQASLNSTLLLDAIGIRGGRLDSIVRIKDSRVRDPLFGTHRQLNGNRFYGNLDFRHDVPGTSWAWGFLTEITAKDYSYRLNSIEASYQSRPFGSVFLEHKNLFGLKARITVANLFNAHDRSFTTLYEDWRNNSPVFYTRNYDLEFSRIYRIQISGTF